MSWENPHDGQAGRRAGGQFLPRTFDPITGFDQPGFGPNAIGELERCVRAGAVGVGELSDKGGGLRGKADGMHQDETRMAQLLEK